MTEFFILIGSICAVGIWVGMSGLKEQLRDIQQQLDEIKQRQDALQIREKAPPVPTRTSQSSITAAQSTPQKEKRTEIDIDKEIRNAIRTSVSSPATLNSRTTTVEKERCVSPLQEPDTQQETISIPSQKREKAKTPQGEQPQIRTTMQEVKQAVPRPVSENKRQKEEVDIKQYDNTQKQSKYTRSEREILKESRASFIEVLFHFFTGGNPVLKGGLIILFFGFGFLLKYTAEYNLVSLELRVLAVFLTGAAMVAGSLLLLTKNPAQRYYALTLQGGGFGVMYLTAFAAFRFYGMLPPLSGFAVQLVLVALCTFLALRQDSLPLVALALCGGFSAPLLMPGKGSHLLLFSYCLLLNCGVVAIAWFRSWRVLNLLGFLATFFILILWTFTSYSRSILVSTDIFLLLFFLLYLVVSILFALRQPLRLKGVVDATLVFALPCIVFSLQTAVIKHIEYGTALSALAMAVIYCAATLFCRSKDFSQLFEIFRIITIIFVSISVPLAFDHSWSAPLWALEGTALLWFGIRNEQRRIGLFGLLIEAGAVCFFLLSTQEPMQWTLGFIDSRCCNEFLFACAFVLSSYLIDKSDTKYSEYGSSPFLFWFGVLAWAAAGRHLVYQLEITTACNLFLLYWTLSIAALYFIKPKIEWQRIPSVYPSLTILLLIFFVWKIVDSASLYINYLGSFSGFLGWSLGLAMQGLLLNFYEEKCRDKASEFVDIMHIGTLYITIAVIAASCAWFGLKMGSPSWGEAAGILVIAAVITFFAQFRERSFLPFLHDEFEDDGQRAWLSGAVPLAGILAAWSLYISFTVKISGSSYLPICNALELPQILVFASLVFWLRQEELMEKTLQKALFWGLTGLIFIAFNAMIARFFHYTYGVAYTIEGLLSSTAYQATIAIVWGIISLTLTAYSSLCRQRQLWLIGAVLLGFVVVKLFIADLSGAGTLSRIIAFLAVGVLMLIIGYFSPLPPTEGEDD